MSFAGKVKLKPEDKKFLKDSINRLIGVIQAIKSDIESDNTSNSTVSQVNAARGAISRVGKEILSRGVFQSLNKLSKEELDEALKLLFKL